eukprot:TRINITY_DN466_c0_g2_i1.p1 TRINITY_DN466_c0_g2~~TRINITY_DN466_c0_g2_i1.p1  ORF type:complete len:313 (+),score=56.80 TRINITY_DN466_c0_g2_i1:329-1267(+)
MAEFAAIKLSPYMDKLSVNRLFEKLENVTPSSDFENLPKFILAKILCYLKPADISKIHIMNKYLLKLLVDNKNTSNIIWKSFLEEGNENIGEIEIDEYLVNIQRNPYECRINKYSLYFKYGTLLKWDKKKMGDSILLSEGDLVLSTGNVTNSWNVALCDKKFVSGVHYVELDILKMETSHYIFYGVGLASVNKNMCCFDTNNDSWVSGYDSRGPGLNESLENPRWSEGDKVSFIFDLQSLKAPRLGFFVNYKWGGGWNFNLKNYNVKEFYMMVCVAHNVSMKIHKYLSGVRTIENYLRKNGSNFNLAKEISI